MAATAVYARVSPIPYGGKQGGTFAVSNTNATTAAFNLQAGKYMVSVIGSTFGTVTLQILGPDDSTWLTAVTAFAANGIASVDLPEGQYRIALA